MSEHIIKNGSITRKLGAFEKRIHEIDLIRGLLIILVVMDHLFWCFKQFNYDWFNATGQTNEFFHGMYVVFNFYWTSIARRIVRQVALFGFCFISGISSAFSRNNWVRAGEMILVFAIIAVGSNLLQVSGWFGDRVMRIDFNVIGVLAWSTLFYCFADKKTWRSILVGLLLSFLMCWYIIPWLEKTPLVHGYAPALWYPEVAQGDWMQLFPYCTFFFMGALFSYFIYAPTRQSLVKVRRNWERPFCFIGRHTLFIYCSHEILLTAIFMAIGAMIH